MIEDKKFGEAGTTITWAPLSVDEAGTTIACGFADGVIRLLTRYEIMIINIIVELIKQ